MGADIGPITEEEILFTTIIGMCGLLISALIIGSAGSALYNMDSGNQEKRSNLEGISAYLKKVERVSLLLFRPFLFYSKTQLEMKTKIPNLCI